MREEVESLLAAQEEMPSGYLAPYGEVLIGQALGRYRIEAKIGAGGMGEVYRARDHKLGRDVAVKVLPRAFSADPERLARFEREARLLAALNHPHIASIYGFEEADGVRGLVLELVDGPTLADRLRKGAMALDEALPIVRQIANALEAAHEKGIVHRDLKPANIKLTPDGAVKVIDFGLAKTLDPAGEMDASAAPTMTAAGTRAGVLVGTTAYMSPEQARGQAVDKRTDIWAFGCVVFEMLTARAPFLGATLSDTIAKILSAEPDWAALPASTPAAVVRLLRRCLERDPKRRLRDLGDVDLALEETASASATPGRRPWVAWAAVIAASVLLTVVTMLAVARLGDRRPSEAVPVQFEVPVPVRLAESGAFSVSPDGRHLVFTGTGADGILRLWVRSLATLETRPLVGTEAEVAHNTSVFWSPDSRFIGFYADGKVKKVDGAGGVPQVICQVPGVAVGGSWNRDGLIVVGNTAGGLLQCPANGGVPSSVTTVGSSEPGMIHLLPSFLPDGRNLLYLRVSRDNPSANGLYLAQRDRPPDEQPSERLLETGFGGAYVPGVDGAGRILFVRDRALWAVPFDTGRLALAGEPVQVASPIGSFRDGAFFGVTASVLVHRGPVSEFQLTWRDRHGTRLGSVGEPGPYLGVALSPDAKRAVLVRENRLNRADQDLWVLDLERDTTTRFSSDPMLESIPAWSADGQTLIFAMGHGSGDVWAQPANGTRGHRLLTTTASGFSVNPLLTTMSTTSDGRFLLFAVDTRTSTQGDLWLLPLHQNGRPTALLQQEFDQRQGSISPDGRWLAYDSNESGIYEVFARQLTLDPRTGLPAVGAAMVVSQGGGTAPRWRGDGQELFYQSSAGSVMAARVSPNLIEKSVELFKAPGTLSHWGVAPDGQRFLLAMPVSEGAPAPFIVVLNWQAALR